MIDLDEALRPWQATQPWNQALPDWTSGRAVAVVGSVAGEHGLKVQHEPGDEEWALLSDDEGYLGMVSVLFPVALATGPLVEWLGAAAPNLTVVPITGFWEEDLRASQDLLRATVLRNGWEDDFDTEAFCANDLFVESV